MVHLTLEGEGLSVKEEITRLQALQILAFVDTNANPTTFTHSSPAVLVPTRVVPQALVGRKESPGEFLRDSGATTNPEKMLALASFYLATSSEEVFAPVDVQRLFERAREPLPKNFSRDFAKVIAARWIDESGTEKGKYWITKTGEKILSEKFAGAGPTTILHSGGTSPKRFVTTMDVLTAEMIEKMRPTYWSGQLETAGDKILFILFEAQKSGIAEMTSQQLKSAAQQLGDKPFTNVGALLAATKNKWMKTPKGGYRIIQPGVAYLEGKLMSPAE